MFRFYPRYLKIIFWITFLSSIFMWFFLIISGLLSGFPLSELTGLLWLFGEATFFPCILMCLIFVIIDFVNEKRKRKQFRLFNFIPFFLSLILFISFFYQISFYQFLKDRQFEHHFEQYQHMVGKIQADQDYRMFVTIPKSFPALRIDGDRYNNIIIIKFWMRGALPTSRGGYVYISNDNWDPKFGFMIDYHPRKIKPCWYAFSE